MTAGIYCFVLFQSFHFALPMLLVSKAICTLKAVSDILLEGIFAVGKRGTFRKTVSAIDLLGP